jgi:hypothetical protein
MREALGRQAGLRGGDGPVRGVAPSPSCPNMSHAGAAL